MAVNEYIDNLVARALGAAVPEQLTGASSYFAKPTAESDPNLIIGDEVRGDVRRWVLGTLYAYWGRHYRSAQDWSTVWIAGSALTKQWSASRSVGQPGDLDILIGVDWPEFHRHNPDYAGIGQAEMATRFNDEFRADLSPTTAAHPLGQQLYEVTWYVNPNSTDIRDIHPYAAFNLNENTWTVRPPELPADWDPRTAYGAGWWDTIRGETAQAQHILRAYRESRARLRLLGPGSPGQINEATRLHEAVQSGAALFSSIHTDRHKAFGVGGAGYHDYFNFRWQAHKEAGTVSALHQLADIDADAHKDLAATCYNGEILDPDHALTLASLVAGRG